MLHNVMRTSIWLISALLAFPVQTFAQKPDESRDPVTAACDRLVGAAREQCLRDQRLRADRPEQGRELAGSCDALVGPEKERCLHKGGTVEAGAQSSRGATRPPVVK